MIHFTERLIGAHPKLRMDLLLWYDFTFQEMAEEEVVVHDISHNISHRG